MNKKPEYSFNREIRDQLEGFEIYLQELGNRENTIRQKCNYTGNFLQWLENQHLQPQDTRYNDLLNFVDYCKLENNRKNNINRKLQSIRNFYEYMKTDYPDIVNPAANLHLQGETHKMPSGIIAFAELEKLYKAYPANNIRNKRNKAILGLLIYQGIITGELHQLEPNHLKLEKGKIYVPGNRRRNSRTLELKPFQILELHVYLTEIRPKILTETDKSKSTRKPASINKTKLENQLFISINGSHNLKSSLLHLFRDEQKINPNIANGQQIRTSVIVNWLKNYNLRQVQYFAGHKYVSSTERYQMNNLDNLQKQLDKYHPLK